MKALNCHVLPCLILNEMRTLTTKSVEVQPDGAVGANAEGQSMVRLSEQLDSADSESDKNHSSVTSLGRSQPKLKTGTVSKGYLVIPERYFPERSLAEQGRVLEESRADLTS